jgi:uncharacterized protein YlxP (DUF503 family)
VAVAETGHTDLWQRAEITACAVSNEAGLVDSVLESADRFVNSDPRARVITARRLFL